MLALAVTLRIASMCVAGLAAVIRIDGRATLSQVQAGRRSAGRIRSTGRTGEQITWAMTLGSDLHFRWWLWR